MASEIEGDLKKTLLDRTDAEKVFRPWWDTVEDYILNISIGLGEHFIFFGLSLCGLYQKYNSGVVHVKFNNPFNNCACSCPIRPLPPLIRWGKQTFFVLFFNLIFFEAR